MNKNKVMVSSYIGETDRFPCVEDRHICLHDDCGITQECSTMTHVLLEDVSENKITFVCTKCVPIVNKKILKMVGN